MTYISNLLSGFYSLIAGMFVTLKYMFHRPATELYPRKKKEMYPRFKGPTAFVVDEKTGDHRCISCDLCAKICPSYCIHLEKVRGEDKKFHLTEYEVDYSLCSLCSLCIEVCPTDALTHAKDYDIPSFSQKDLIIDFLKPFSAKGGPAPSGKEKEPSTPEPVQTPK